MSNDEDQIKPNGQQKYEQTLPVLTCESTSLTRHRTLRDDGLADVTIKFNNSTFTLAAHKATLATGSAFFASHLMQVSAN